MFLLIELVAKDVVGNDHDATLVEIFGDEGAKAKLIEYARYNVIGMSRFILQTMLVVTILFSSLYLFGALRDERQDRSILFWKSMPVSDTLEVWSKLVFPLLLSPILTMLLAFASDFLLALIVAGLSLSSSFDLFFAVLFNESMYSLPLQYLRLLTFYMAWSLPCVAWFLLVSVRTKSRVFPWAVGAPLLLTLVISLVSLKLNPSTDSAWFARHVTVQWVVGNIPPNWTFALPSEMFVKSRFTDPRDLFSPDLLNTAAWHCTQSLSLLIGVVTGVALLLLTIRRSRFVALI